jgi:hypothetical protein
MSTRSSAANLGQAMKTLRVEWQEARASWRDVKAQEFEQKYLEDLPGQVARAASVIEELDSLLRKVKADCE